MLRRRRAPAAGRGAEHQRKGRLAAEHIVDLGHLVHDLVHGGEGEGHHARADDGPEAAARRAYTRADVGFLGYGRGPQPLDAEL